MNKKYHLLYKVTNTQTSQEYIGVHSTDNIQDGYMGSGALLKSDINKFGVTIFSREIIDTFESRADLLMAEKSIVNEDYLKLANTYNLVFGGGGTSTIKEKRKLFNLPIYSKKANELEFKKEKFAKYDDRFQYIFDFSKSEIVKPNYQRGAFAERIMDFIVSNWQGVADDLTLLYNNAYTNKIGERMLTQLLCYKGIVGKIYVELFDWDGNFIEKKVLILE
jgi:hypothetical protein